MPYELDLPQILKQAGWKVKIRDAERLEEPHVTILRKIDTWRLSLRSGEFLDKDHKWNQIDKGVRQAIINEWETLKTRWDAMYPGNPIRSDDDEQND